MVNRKLTPKRFFTSGEKSQIVRAIQEAEEKTSGEIRVYLERRARRDLMNRAKQVFEKLGMTKTQKRNGILIYFSLTDQRFSILGDRGIHEKAGDGFWKEVVSTIEGSFRRDEFTPALLRGIRQLGETLALYFPKETSDMNELPNEIPE